MIGARLFQLFVGAVIVMLVAGLTHFASVLLLPKVADQDAYSVLAPRAAIDHVTLLPSARPGETLVPFLDPSTVQGICVFDLAKAPARIKVSTQEGRLLTLSFRTPDGHIFYSITDRAALHNTIDVHLVTDAQLKAIEDNDVDDQGMPEELRLKAPTRQGLVVLTALVARPEDKDRARRQIEAVKCAPEPISPPS